MKLAQRVALTRLPPRVASWRYQRGTRLLMGQSFQASSSSPEDDLKHERLQPVVDEEEEGGMMKEDDDDVDIPEQIDEVIQQLLDGLRDQDTSVRWSAAKGIGRITMRLPVDFADEVVEAVLELFNEGEGDGAWHGGCMACAELARRGLLLPERLEEVVPLALKALTYDVRMGAHSVGSHVRDAACYLAWAFARAYAPSVMLPYVTRLAQGLLTVAVFDREVNCRRAAAAAFQENVGRQGNFPHGIEINTNADYFALGNRHNAAQVVGFFISQYSHKSEHTR